MKKIVSLIFVVLLTLSLSACIDLNYLDNRDIINSVDDKVDVKDLCEGGIQDGVYTSSIKAEQMDMELTISEDSATLIVRNYDDPNAFVNVTEALIHKGTYKVKKNGNITFTFGEVSRKWEYIGTEENVAEYIAHEIEKQKDFLEEGLQTQEEYDEDIAKIYGEASDAEMGEVSMTARLDIPNGKFYEIEYSTGEGLKKETLKFTYYSTGIVRSVSEQQSAISQTTYYDEYGYKLSDDVQREYYDDGIVKSEYYPTGRNQHGYGSAVKYFYDQDGLLTAMEGMNSWGDLDYRDEYEYNSDNILVFERSYGYDAHGVLSWYSEKTHFSYSRKRVTVYNLDGYTLEDKRIYSDYEYWNDKKRKSFSIWGDGELSETLFDENEREVSRISYDKDGNVSSIQKYKYNEQGALVTEYYDENETLLSYTVKTDGELINTYTMEKYTADGTITARTVRTVDQEIYTYYDEDGILREEEEYSFDEDGYPYCTKHTVYNRDGTIKYYVIQGQYYDANGNPIDAPSDEP